MHWFRRAAIAFVVVTGFELWYFPYGWRRLWNLAYESFWQGDIPMPVSWQSNASAVFASLPILFVALVAYGVLSYFLGRRATADGETRCRKCGYILRGITEPRCPECGERI